MSEKIKNLIVAAIGLVVALVLGLFIGKDLWIAPMVFSGALILIAAHSWLLRGNSIDALVLGCLLIGYFTGNRGFAQLRLGPGPLFVGEVGLALCLAVAGTRMATKRQNLIPPTPLSYAIAALVGYGLLRLLFDLFLGTGGGSAIETLRDSAMIYYALFFFIAFQVGITPNGQKFVQHCMLITGWLMLPILVLTLTAPAALYSVRLGGVPVFFQKGDLLIAFLLCSALFLYFYPARGLLRVGNIVLSIIFASSILSLFSRAVFVGMAVAFAFLFLARRPGLPSTVAVMSLFAAGVLIFSHYAGLDVGSGLAVKAADKVQSIFDFAGSGDYRGDYGNVSADNNKFRTTWWRAVIDETVEKNPVFGVGFGYNLADEFVRRYFGNRGDGFTTRSPHSIWLTMFGRLGLVGLCLFGAVIFLLLREAFRTARAVAHDRLPSSTLAPWGATLVIIGAASFGVVLEGPMGGITFWSFVGFAASAVAGKLDAASAVAGDNLPIPREARAYRPLLRPSTSR